MCCGTYATFWACMNGGTGQHQSRSRRTLSLAERVPAAEKILVHELACCVAAVLEGAGVVVGLRPFSAGLRCADADRNEGLDGGGM